MSNTLNVGDDITIVRRPAEGGPWGEWLKEMDPFIGKSFSIFGVYGAYIHIQESSVYGRRTTWAIPISCIQLTEDTSI